MNANDTLNQFNCTDNYYRFTGNMLLTDGAKALADCFSCYWLRDIISSYQVKLQKEGFQVWCLKKCEEDTAVITCENGSGRQLVKQRIDYTDFNASNATLWVEGNVMLLPSED